MLTSLAINRGGLGRFGNNCFTIAGVIGTAINNGQPYGFPEWIVKDNENFGANADRIYDYLVNPLPPIVDAPFKDYGYFWGYRDLHLPTGNWNIDAHMQSDKFFNHCLPVIREVFRFKDEPQQNDYVAIHYRAGDYTEGEDGHHPRCTKEYYERAIQQFPRGTNFLVFTDDVMSANKVMPDGVEFAPVGKSYITDFKLMKRCRHFITANSSFSSFAAALGEAPDKIVIQPSRWFGKSMPPEFGTEDIYLKDAIII